jgi:Fe-coproporphyrin III synthase
MRRTVSFSRQTRNVFFHILTTCNLRCRYCYINQEAHGAGSLPLATIKAWLEVLSHRHRATNLIFLGGEPTLHPDLAQAVKIARDLDYTSITIDTNGYLFNRILDSVTPSEVDTFSFSLDGSCPDTNDPIRGKGSFSKCVSGIAAAKKRGFDVSLIYTVSAENIDDLQAMSALLPELRIDRFFIQVIGLRGRSATTLNNIGRPATLQIPGKDWLEKIPAVAMEIAGMGIHVIYPKVYLQPHEPFACAGLVSDNYFVFPNGRVYRCPLCEDFPVHSLFFQGNQLCTAPPINEKDLFNLTVPEGCVMNKIIQPENILYHENGTPKYKIACCILKEEITPDISS